MFALLGNVKMNTEFRKRNGPRLRESDPAARGSQNAKSRNLGPVALQSFVYRSRNLVYELQLLSEKCIWTSSREKKTWLRNGRYFDAKDSEMPAK